MPIEDTKNKIDILEGKKILLILSHLTEQLRKEIPHEFVNAIKSKDEARSAIATLLENIGGRGSIPSKTILADEAQSVAIAREILKLLIDDEAARPKVEHLVNFPPQDSQMSVEVAIAGAVILGAVITWLQTKINIQVTRKNGKTDFKFELHKDATDTEVIKNVSKSVTSLLTS